MKYNSTLLTIPRPASRKRKRMPIENRAAQFAPFAALTGFEAEITEVCRFTEFRLHPAEDLQQELEFKLNLLHKIEHSHPCVTIRYFLPDDTKEGGAFFAVRGVLSVIDQQASLLYLEGKPPIAIHSICEIDSSLFNRKRT